MCLFGENTVEIYRDYIVLYELNHFPTKTNEYVSTFSHEIIPVPQRVGCELRPPAQQQLKGPHILCRFQHVPSGNSSLCQNQGKNGQKHAKTVRPDPSHLESHKKKKKTCFGVMKVHLVVIQYIMPSKTPPIMEAPPPLLTKDSKRTTSGLTP